MPASLKRTRQMPSRPGGMRQRCPQATQRMRSSGSFSARAGAASRVSVARTSPSGVDVGMTARTQGNYGLDGPLDRGEDKAKLEMAVKPGVPAPNLAPRMGSEDLREKGGVTYRELRTRSLLNRCDSPR